MLMMFVNISPAGEKSVFISDSITGKPGKVPAHWEKIIEGKGELKFETAEDETKSSEKQNLLGRLEDNTANGRIAAARKFACEHKSLEKKCAISQNVVIEFDLCIKQMSSEKWNEVDIFINDVPSNISDSLNIIFIQKSDNSKYIRVYDGIHQQTLMKWRIGVWYHFRISNCNFNKGIYELAINDKKFTSNRMRGTPKKLSQFLVRTHKKGKAVVLIDNLKVRGTLARKDNSVGLYPFGKNLLVNGSFENGNIGWHVSGGSFAVSTGEFVTGQHSLHFHVSQNDDIVEWRVDSIPKISIKPGDVYELSAFVKHNHSAGVVEVAVEQIDKLGDSVVHSIACLLKPGNADWKNYKIDFTTSLYTKKIYVYIRARRMKGDFWVDDVILKRIKPLTPKPLNPKQAVIFPGSPAKFGMSTENPIEDENSNLIIGTTASRYVFDRQNGIISCYQKLQAKRKVATLDLGKALENLRIVFADNNVVVLQNDKISIGIQGDSLIMFYAIRNNIPIKITSLLSAKYFAREGGYAIALDGKGGFGVYPSAPQATGLAYSFVKQSGQADKPPWTIQLELKKCYRLGFAVFPPRPFDFKRNYRWIIVHTCGYPPAKAIKEWRKYANVLVLHASPRKISGGIWEGKCPWIGPYKLSPKHEEEFKRVISVAHSLGMKVLPYMAPGMHSNPNLDDFINEMKSLRKKYQFDSVYYDGLYPAADWTKSYILMRMTRDIVGADNPIFIHNTQSPPLGDQRNGRIYCPFIDTYSDFVLKAESVFINGLDDPYLRYVVSGYGTYSGIGMAKVNRAKNIGNEIKYHLKMIELFGQARWCTYPDKNGIYPGENGPIHDYWTDICYPKLKELEKEFIRKN